MSAAPGESPMREALPPVFDADYWEPKIEGNQRREAFFPSLQGNEIRTVRSIFDTYVPRALNGDVAGERYADGRPFKPALVGTAAMIRYDVERMLDQPAQQTLPRSILTEELVRASLKDDYSGYRPEGPFIPFIERAEARAAKRDKHQKENSRKLYYQRTSWFSLLAKIDKVDRRITLPVVGPNPKLLTAQGRRPISGEFMQHDLLPVGYTVESHGEDLVRRERLLGVEVFSINDAVWEEMLRQNRLLAKKYGRFGLQTSK